jgi:threonyl-tRNA synthetase
MFPPLLEESGAELRLRPMNCPHHHLVYSSSRRSYRQLPLRFAEYGQVYRHENSGSLSGLARVRGLCQNDAHIYISPQQAGDELEAVLKLFEHCYRALGLSDYRYRLSLGDRSKPNSFPGAHSHWDESERILRDVLKRLGLNFFEAAGEAAFYGPKIDVQMSIRKREESVASVQLDFLSGERFNLEYIGSDGKAHRPWVIHRAPLGSHERFIAMLLEYNRGRLPAWLAPVQVALIPVSDEHRPLANALLGELLSKAYRAEVFDGAGNLAKRLKAAHLARPFGILVLGDRECAGGPLKLQLREENIEFERCNLSDVLPKALGSLPSPI